jgi:concanavalin A-like lectin/glucanase superfamily protein
VRQMTMGRVSFTPNRIFLLICGLALCLCGSAASGGDSKIDPASLLDQKFKLVLNLKRSKTLRSRDVGYSFFPDGRHCAFTYTGPRRPATIAELTKMGLRTTVYLSPTASAKTVKAYEDAGAEVGVTGYWGARGNYSSLIGVNSVQEAFDAIATSRLAIRKLVSTPTLPSGSCGGHISTFSFPVDRNTNHSAGYGAVFLDSNFLSLSFSSQGCLSILLGLEGPERVVLRRVNRNTMKANKVPNELIYYQLLAGQFDGAVRQAREAQFVQFSLRDFTQKDMKLLKENIGEYGTHPAIWHATDGMIASLEYAKKNIHILEIKRASSKRYEITLGVEKDTFAPYLIVPLTVQLPRRFPIESATFEGVPCAVNIVERGNVPHVTVPVDAWLARGCAMTLDQSAPDMTIPDRMPVTLSITNKLAKPITDARLTWIASSRFSGLTPAKRGRGTQVGVKAGPGLAVASKDNGPFTLAPGATRKIVATASTVRGARFGIIPVQAVLVGKVEGRTRVFLGGFEITVMPVLRVEMSPQLRMPLPKGEHQYFEVRLANGKGRDKFISHKAGPCKGVLTFDLPEGMTVEPKESPFEFGENEKKSFIVKVTNNAWGKDEVKVKPLVRLAGSAEALEVLEPGATVIRDPEQVDHKPLDDTGLLVYAGWNDPKRGGRFTRSAGRATPHIFPHTRPAYARGGVKGMCMESQPNCSIHATYKNIDYRRGTIAFWFKRDPKVRNENRYMADPTKTWKIGGRSNYGEGMVFVSGVQRDSYSSGGLNIRRYPTWGDKTGYIEVSYQCLFGRKYYVQAPYPRSMEKEWCHVAVTWDIKKRVLELFVNGKLAGRAKPGDEPWRGVAWDNAADWGHRLVVSTMDHGHWSGTMRDEFYVYNRPLSADEIRANMKAAGAGAKKP